MHIAGSCVMLAQDSHPQGVDEQILVHPPADSWPGYHGDYSGRRHSSLTQITPQNVKNLALAWAFQTGQSAEIKSSPLLVNGVLYFTVPENIWAVDARSGHQIWHYTYPRTMGNTLVIAASPCIRTIFIF
jgi:alcohol dehydrogenase (cytochrome c)